MFQRGSRIVITESSASKRAHPAVGDKGYISNMYLFFRDRFILLDALFFSYESDLKKNSTRREKKRFIIDMGMNKKLKEKIDKYGLARKFFLNNRNVANLTMVAHSSNDRLSVLELPRVEYMWSRLSSYSRGQRELIKIPYGQIAMDPDRRKCIYNESTRSIRCWIECMLPMISAISLQFGIDHNYNPIYDITVNMSKSVDKYAHPKLAHGRPYFSTYKDIDAILTSYSKANMIKAIKEINHTNAISKFLLDNCDNEVLAGDYYSRGDVMNFVDVWKKVGLTAASGLKGTPEYVKKFITGMFFRAIITSRDTEISLRKMEEANVFPCKNNAKQIAEGLEHLKIRGNLNSAALNRAFEKYSLLK